MYNPYASPSTQQMQLDRLYQQKNMIESQINMLSQQAPQPAVNVNVQGQPQQAQNNAIPSLNPSPTYDAGVVYVDSIEEAKKSAAASIPVMYIDRAQPLMYMKAPDGSLKAFQLEEVPMEESAPESALKKQVDDLQGKMDMILAALTQQQAQPAQAMQAQPVQEKPKQAPKKPAQREGDVKNG